MNNLDLFLVGAVLMTFVAMVITEQLQPRNAFPTVSNWLWKGSAFVLLMFVINGAVSAMVPEAWRDQITIHDMRPLGFGWGLVFSVVCISFADYWYHRASHAFNWLWRAAHQMHHSVSRVDTVGFVYTHPVEITIFALENLVILQLLFPVEPAAAVVSAFIVAFCGMFQHWNIKTPQWLGYIIQRPESHCLHHELNIHARNYGNFPIWDILFGTFRNPASFDGKVGFEGNRGNQFWRILFWQDVNADLAKPAKSQ